MGLGYVGAGGTVGGMAALRQVLQDRIDAEKRVGDDQQQQLNNAHTATLESNAARTMDFNEKLRQDTLNATVQNRNDLADSRAVDDTRDIFKMTPAGTNVTPMRGRLVQAGLSPTLTRDEQPSLAVRNLPGHLTPAGGVGQFQNPQDVQDLTGKTYANEVPAMDARTVKSKSPQELQLDQANSRADAAGVRADAAGARADAGLANTEQHQRTMEGFAAQAAARAGNKPDTADASRMDRSYAASAKALDDLRKPVESQLERISRFRDSINQQTPQADSVLAPEVMIIMAGGQGSGVRITNSEIERVLNGRSNLESLKAALNRWSLDPSKALSVTPVQRQQMRALVSTVAEKGQQKLDAVTQAHDELIDAPDVTSHRQIVQRARKAFDTITAGGGAAQPGGAPAGGMVKMKAPDGRSLNVPADKVQELEAHGAVRAN